MVFNLQNSSIARTRHHSQPSAFLLWREGIKFFQKAHSEKNFSPLAKRQKGIYKRKAISDQAFSLTGMSFLAIKRVQALFFGLQDLLSGMREGVKVEIFDLFERSASLAVVSLTFRASFSKCSLNK